MNYMLCRNRVRNFDQWKRVFDGHADAHRGAGLKLVHLWQDEDNPSISPDGRWIAYSSDEAGGTTEHVYVRPFPNVMETVWQVSPEAGDSPRWSPDGRELFYRTGDNTIAAAAVLPGPTFTLGRRRTVLSLSPYQSANRAWGIGNDGRLLVLKRISAPPNRKILVTQNISTELRQGER